MNLSKAIAMIKSFEGCVLHAYQDSVGVWTIGWGHTGPDVHKGLVCTQDQADRWLQQDLNSAVKRMIMMIHVPLSDNKFCALADFCFNLGTGAFYHSHLLTYLNAGTSDQLVSAEFLKWTHAGGKVLPGLVRRRQAEHDLFLSTVA